MAIHELTPFELREKLVAYARDFTQAKASTHKLLDAGRGNPNWIATTPREAFFLLGQFGLAESKRVWDEPDLGGLPHADVIADRLDSFLSHVHHSPGAELLRRAIEYGVTELGFDPDELVHELTDSILGDTYPQPDRMLRHAEQVVQRYLAKVMCGNEPPPGILQLFAVEGATAAICYVFDSLMTNRLLRRGDTIALGTPLFTPYVELPHVEDFELGTVAIEQTFSTEEIAKLENPRIKAFLLVNPSNPASLAMAPETRRRIIDLVQTKRPDLIIVTDDVYGTFADGFRSLAADLPYNTLLVYSYSKHFGCTGWRLGVIGLHKDNVLDRKLLELPEEDKARLRVRYASLSVDPDRIRFIDRMVADSRDVALAHTAGLSTPQQVQMTLFSLFSLLDEQDHYTQRCRRIVHERFTRLVRGLGLELPDDARRIGYYADFDLEAWGRVNIGEDFVDYVRAHHQPSDVLIGLAQRFGTVLLGGGGAGPPWSVRVSLANLDEDEYEALGPHLKEIITAAVERWRATRQR